jgi:hypothetical protein
MSIFGRTSQVNMYNKQDWKQVSDIEREDFFCGKFEKNEILGIFR